MESHPFLGQGVESHPYLGQGVESHPFLGQGVESHPFLGQGVESHPFSWSRHECLTPFFFVCLEHEEAYVFWGVDHGWLTPSWRGKHFLTPFGGWWKLYSFVKSCTPLTPGKWKTHAEDALCPQTSAL